MLSKKKKKKNSMNIYYIKNDNNNILGSTVNVSDAKMLIKTELVKERKKEHIHRFIEHIENINYNFKKTHKHSCIYTKLKKKTDSAYQ